MKIYKGSCYCQKITFEVEAEKVSWVGHCHCNQCQKIHAAPYVTWVEFFCDSYKIEDPQKNYKIFKGKQADRGFCTNCGSSFFFRYHNIEHEFMMKEVFFLPDPVLRVI